MSLRVRLIIEELGQRLIGFLILGLIVVFDYWVWSSLFSASTAGAVIGFTILAIISIILTIVAVIVGALLIFSD